MRVCVCVYLYMDIVRVRICVYISPKKKRSYIHQLLVFKQHVHSNA